MNNEFAKSYANALFELSLEKNNIELINDQFMILINSFIENEQIIKIMNQPKLSRADKKQIIKNVYYNFDINIINFLYVLIDNDRISEIIEIGNSFTKLFNYYQNTINVSALTTIALDKVQIDRLKEKLMIKYRRKIEIVNIIDTQIVGGMRLIINDDIIDYSIKNQLQNLKSHILSQI